MEAVASRVLAIVVAYFPSEDALRRLLQRLATQVAGTLVVDNSGRGNGTASTVVLDLAPSCADLRLVCPGTNLGVAAALNIGIRVARSEGFTHVLFSDQDSMPEERMVEALCRSEREVLDQGANVAAVGPTYVDERTGSVYPFQANAGHWAFYRHAHATQSSPNLRVMTLITSGSLVRIDVLDAVGEMDEELFIDGVDLEWCHRATSAGYALIGTCNAHMSHRMGENLREIWFLKWWQISIYPPNRIYYGLRNCILLLRRNYLAPGWKLRFALFWSGMTCVHILFGKERLQYVRMALRAIRDGAKGRAGRLD